jgi:FkbM family methyltransferase
VSVLDHLRRLIRGTEQRKSFALNGLDLKLLPYLNYRKGFFVEAGANDGLTQSNTYYFERYKGWRGMLVEPIPELAQRCRSNRPRCIVESCALVEAGLPSAEISLRYANLMSVVDGAFKSKEEEERHVQTGCDIQNITPSTLQVPVATMSALLDKHGIKRVDFLSLDVEGYELNALRGIDFERHAPGFMLIEARFRKEIDEYLAPLYEPVAELSHHDVLYVKRNGKTALEM